MKQLNTNWDKLRIFYWVAHTKSFSGAAEVLNLSQSSVSRTVADIERKLKFKLLERLGKGLSLTCQGRILFDALGKMRQELYEAGHQIQQEENDASGFVRIACPSGFATAHLTKIIPGFLKAYPNITLSIYGNDILPNLHSDEVDIMISPFIEKDDSLIQTYLKTFHLRLYASQNYLDQFGTPQTAEDLDHHRLLSYGDHKSPHPFPNVNWHLSLGMEHGSIREPYIMVNSAVGLYNLACADMGIISISAQQPQLQQSPLVEVLPHLKSRPVVNAYVIYSNRMRNIKRIKIFKDYVMQYFLDH